MSSKAAASCFPNVAQQSVSADDVENLYGRGGIEELKKTLPFLGLGKAALAASCFNPIKPKPSIPKPVLGQKTCSGPAHSQQVALEECLLRLNLGPSGEILDFAPLTKSWTCELVYTVKEIAVNVDAPTLIVHMMTGRSWVVVLGSSRCLWAWPLKVQGERKLCLQHPIKVLEPIVLTEPYPSGVTGRLNQFELLLKTSMCYVQRYFCCKSCSGVTWP